MVAGVQINKKTMQMNLRAGLLVIFSYTLITGAKLISFFHSNFWADVVECVAAFGFFGAFVTLI